MANIVDVTLRLIDKFSSPLNNFGARLSDSSKQLINMGKSIDRTGKNISSVGSTLTRRVTAPIVAIGVSSVKAAADFESAMATVKAITNADSNEMKKMEDNVKQLMSTTKFSATEIANAYKYMGMAGWDANDITNQAVNILKLANAGGEDLAKTSDIVTDGLTAFGMSAKDTKEFCDVLARTSTTTNTNVGLMGETFKYVGAVAGTMGYSIQDVASAAGMMASAGVKGSMAGTSLRNIIKNLVAPTKTTQAAIDKLGLSIKDGNGKLKPFSKIIEDLRRKTKNYSNDQKALIANQLGGTRAMAGLSELMKMSDDEFKKITKSINNYDGACDKMSNTMDKTANGSLAKLKNNFSLLKIEIGKELLPYVVKFSNKLRDWISKFRKLPKETKDSIFKFIGYIALIGPSLWVFGKIVSSVGKVVKFIGLLGKAFKTFGSFPAIIASPAGKVVLIVLAIAAAAFIVYKNWNKIKPKIKKIFDDLIGVYDDFKEWCRKNKKEVEMIKKIFKGLGDILYIVFSTGFKTCFGTALTIVSTTIRTITRKVEGIIKIVTGVIEIISGIFQGDWSKAWNGAKKVASGAFESLTADIRGYAETIKGYVESVIDSIESIEIPDWVPGVGGKTVKDAIIDAKGPASSGGGFASGTLGFSHGGLATINEKGGEIVDLPHGSRVYPHDKSVAMAFKQGARSSGNITVNIPKLADNLSVRSDEDINAIACAIASKLEKVSNNITGGVSIGYSY